MLDDIENSAELELLAVRCWQRGKVVYCWRQLVGVPVESAHPSPRHSRDIYRVIHTIQPHNNLSG